MKRCTQNFRCIFKLYRAFVFFSYFQSQFRWHFEKQTYNAVLVISRNFEIDNVSFWILAKNPTDLFRLSILKLYILLREMQ